MLVHIGNSVASAMSPDRIEALRGRFMAAFGARMMAGLDKKLAQMAAEKKPAVKARVAPRPAAKRKPVSRAARLRNAEAEVKATQARDGRCVWRDMSPA